MQMLTRSRFPKSDALTAPHIPGRVIRFRNRCIHYVESAGYGTTLAGIAPSGACTTRHITPQRVTIIVRCRRLNRGRQAAGEGRLSSLVASELTAALTGDPEALDVHLVLIE